MNNLGKKHSRGAQLYRCKDITFIVAIPIIFVLFVLGTTPWSEQSQYHVDEGYNLMKALLLHDGYPLYTSIWSDQPPAFTYQLAALFSIAHPSIVMPRFLILIYSALLVAVLVLMLLKDTNLFSASMSILLLCFSQYYVRLSVSTMIGVPAYSLATTSAVLLMLGMGSRPMVSLAVSGVVFAVAAQTQFTAFLVLPAIVAWISVSATQECECDLTARRALSVWFGVVIFIFASMQLISGEGIASIVYTHWHANVIKEPEMQNFPSSALIQMLTRDIHLIVAASAGIAGGIWFRNMHTLVPTIWLMTVIAVHSFHRPFWYYHYLQFSIPLVWLSGYGIFYMLKGILETRQLTSIMAFLVKSLKILWLSLFIGLLLSNIQAISHRFIASNSKNVAPMDMEALETLAKKAELTRWVFADSPIYPFRIGLRVPPEIAVISDKRRVSGQFDNNLQQFIFGHYSPEQVLLLNKLSPECEALLDRSYYLAYDNQNIRVFWRNDLIGRP